MCFYLHLFNKKRFRQSVLLVSLVFFSFSGVGLNLTLAQTPSFAVTPTKIEVELEPGKGETREITILNNLGYQSSFSLYVEDFSLNDLGKNLSFSTNNNEPFSLKNYISLSDRFFSLSPGESKKVLVNINLPSNVSLGSLHSVLFVEAEPNTGIVGATRVNSRIGVLIFSRVIGEVLEEGYLQNFDVVGGNWQFGNLIKPQIYVSFKNEGNTYLNPYGFVEVKNILGQIKKVIEVSPWFVLPESTRIREVSLEDNFYGVYWVNIFQNRGYENIIDKESVIMVRIPWLFISIISILLGIVIIVSSFKLRFKNEK